MQTEMLANYSWFQEVSILLTLNLHDDAWHVQTKQANDTERMLVCIRPAKSLDRFIVAQIKQLYLYHK